MNYEYGIAHYKHDPNGPWDQEQGPHRTGMTLEEAVEWMEEWENYGAVKEAFYIIRRPLPEWERYVPIGKIKVDTEARLRSIREKAATLPEGPL